MLDFDPDTFINCEVERRLFSSLLSVADQARILAIRGASGTGKSQLLRSFAHQCRTAYPRRIPVCLVSLDTPGDAVLPLVQEMERQLSRFGLTFPTFKQIESARVANDFSKIRASVHLEGAIFEGATDVRISGTMINPERVEMINISAERVEFTAEQVDLAQEVSVKAFFDDLRVHCAQSPVVLLLDTYEKCRPSVHAWINEYFLERLFFDLDQRPQQLMTVIAGQDTPLFQQFWPRHMCEVIVQIVPHLSAWEREHIAAYCLTLGISPESAPIEPIYQIAQTGGMTPELIKNIISTMQSQVRPR